MARIGAWLAAGALVIVVLPVRAEEKAEVAAVEALPPEPVPVADGPHSGCHSCRSGQGKARHLLQWLTYRSSDHPGPCGCCRQSQACCQPPLYTFFLCDGNGDCNGPPAVAPLDQVAEPSCGCKHRLFQPHKKCGRDKAGDPAPRNDQAGIESDDLHDG